MLDHIYIVSFFLVLAVAFVFTFRRQSAGDPVAIWWLKGYFWALLVSIFISYVFSFGYGAHFIHLIRFAHFFYLLVLPFSFMYMRRLLLGITWTRWDWLMLVVPGIYLVDLMPFFLMSAEEKLRILSTWTPEHAELYYDEGWFMPRYGHVWIRRMQTTIYLAAEIILFWRVSRKHVKGAEFEAKESAKWLRWLLITQGLAYALPNLLALIADNNQMAIYNKGIGLVGACIQCYYLIFHPEILYSGTNVWYKTRQYQPTAAPEMPFVNQELPTATNGESFEAKQHNVPIETYQIDSKLSNDKALSMNAATVHGEALEMNLTKNNGEVLEANPTKTKSKNLPDETLQEIGVMVEDIMERRKPYLQPDFGLYELSMLSGISIHKLSAFINSQHGQNFYTFLNGFRIRYCLMKLDQGEHFTKTLEAIAEESGFQSRTTFIRAFKKVTGKTPSEYIQQSSTSLGTA